MVVIEAQHARDAAHRQEPRGAHGGIEQFVVTERRLEPFEVRLVERFVVAGEASGEIDQKALTFAELGVVMLDRSIQRLVET